ncbi:Glycosyltransferase [Plasmodiophora brassicae]|uniref:Glycosyltransferase n=1 Tax=Plasmodiophora brassicae TaxID=37360 RepID=A0A0G4IXC2_PLABS|nr:hypothetical protein PBRA_007493 [Plasmodiophora brassicae]
MTARTGRPAALEAILTSERSRVVVLNWKDNDPTADIYFPDSTMTTCRNRLGQYGRELEAKLQHRFMYWIWMDDDIVFETKPERDALHKWEDFLLEWQPAIGLTDVYYVMRTPAVESVRGNDPPVWSVFSFDALFNAQHRETLDYLTPLIETFDNKSWHASALINIYKAAAYVDHILEYRGLRVHNGGHDSPVNYDASYWYLKDELEPTLISAYVPEPIATCLRNKGAIHLDLSLDVWGTPRKKYFSYRNPTAPDTIALRTRCSYAYRDVGACVQSIRACKEHRPLYKDASDAGPQPPECLPQ